MRIVSPSTLTWYVATAWTGGPPRTRPVSSENTPSCHGQVTAQRAPSTVPSDKLARACEHRLAIAYTVPLTLKRATASLAAYTRFAAPGGSSDRLATGVKPSARAGRRAMDSAAPAPPRVSSMSHSDICTHVNVGVSLRVYEDALLSRSSITRSRNSPGLSPSNATMN